MNDSNDAICEHGIALRRTLGGFQYMSIAVGCMIGIGWITVIGEWLTRAGPLGAISGFLLGAVVIAAVAACYAELTGMMPVSGGDVVFAERVFGAGMSFFVGWFLILMAISVASFEALSFVWVAETLAPWLGARAMYQVLGHAVTVQQVVLGLGVLTLMYVFNRVGTKASSRIQDGLTVFKLILMVAFIGAGLILGDAERLFQTAPMTAERGSSFGGALWIAATCAFWLGGFQVISQAAEERSPATSLRLIGLITTASVAIGLLFYIGVVIAVAASAPLSQLSSAELPAAAAAEAVFRSKWGAVAVLLAGLSGILATLNAFLLSGSRLSLALARLGFLPQAFARVDRRGTPAHALTVITTIAACGIFSGKGLLLPVVNTASMSLIVSYVLVCAAVLRLRRIAPDVERPFRVPGGVITVWLTAFATAAMAVFIILNPALEKRGIPIEWSLSAGWLFLGALLWWLRRKSPPCTVAANAPGAKAAAVVDSAPPESVSRAGLSYE